MPAPAGTAASVCSVFTPGLVLFPPLSVAVQGSTEEEQHMTKGTSLIESQHHHLLHCLEKTTVSTSTALPSLGQGSQGGDFTRGLSGDPVTLPPRAGTHPGLPTTACSGLNAILLPCLSNTANDSCAEG